MPMARDNQLRPPPLRFMEGREESPEESPGNGGDGVRRTGRPLGSGNNRVVANGSARDEAIHVHFLQILNICRILAEKGSAEADVPALAQGDSHADKAAWRIRALSVRIHKACRKHH
jgi:hypothetical protein